MCNSNIASNYIIILLSNTTPFTMSSSKHDSQVTYWCSSSYANDSGMQNDL